MSAADREAFSRRVADMLTDVDPATRALIVRVQAVGAAPAVRPTGSIPPASAGVTP